MKRLAPLLLVLALTAPAVAGSSPACTRGCAPSAWAARSRRGRRTRTPSSTSAGSTDREVGYGDRQPLVEITRMGRLLMRPPEDTDWTTRLRWPSSLRDHIGDYLHARAALFPELREEALRRRVLGQATVNAQANKPCLPSSTRGVSELVGHAGLGFASSRGAQARGTAKYITWERLEEVYTAATSRRRLRRPGGG